MDKAAPKKASTIGSVVVGTIAFSTIVTAIAASLAYACALLVVKVGIPFPRLVVVVPILLILGVVWAATSKLGKRDGAVTILIAAALFVGLFAVLHPSRPSDLFTTKSDVSDVHVHGEDVSMTLTSHQEMNAMPSFGTLASYAALFTCLAFVGLTLTHGAVAIKKRRDLGPTID
ncbi:MAG TPA: hypothetical protein VGM90_11390 [Kofleriaceae bacterium]|jgi:uncharacterized membrane protein